MYIAVDDSEIPIGGSLHTILAAVLVQDAHAVEHALQRLKEQFGLAATDEVKWNGCKVEPRKREALSNELLVLLHEAAALVTISEGTDRQRAAEHLAIQIADYLDSNKRQNSARVEVAFDEGIIADPAAYANFLKFSGRAVLGRIAFRNVRSHDSGLVQMADILAGLNRLTTDIALGRPDKDIQVFDDAIGENVDIDLLSYICLSLRWSTWGEVPPPPNPEDPKPDGTWPFKHLGGYGLRLQSTLVTDNVREAIYSARAVYMGCLH
jgi:Protein of unknown function (DUF3800)